jgi:hypothetical protein
MKITQDFIEAGASDAGGWNWEQFRILGVETPPRAGWRTRIEGTEISRTEANEFLALRGKGKSSKADGSLPTTLSSKQAKLAKRQVSVSEAVIEKVEAALLWIGPDKKSFVGKALKDIPVGSQLEIRREGDVYVLTATINNAASPPKPEPTPHPKSIAAKFPPPDKSEVYDDGLGCPFTPGKFFHHNDGRIEQVG